MNTSMKSHLELLGWINIIAGTFMLLIGVLVATLLFFLSPVTDDSQAAFVVPAVAILVGSLLGAMSIGQVIAGIGLLKHKSWSRLLALVVAVFALFSFPVGTIIAIYAFWVLTQPETHQLLSAS